MGWEERAAKAKKGHRPSLKNWERDNLASIFPPYAEAILKSTHPYRSFRINNGGRGGGAKGDVLDQSLSLEDIGGGRNGISYGSSYHGGEVMYPIVLDAAQTPPKEFHERYEAKCIPVVIRNVPYGVRNATSATHGNNRDGDMMMEEEKKECDGRHHNSINNHHHTAQTKEWPAVHLWKFNALSTDSDLSHCMLKCGEDDDGYTIRMKLKYFMEYLHHNRDDSPLYIFDATFDEDKYAKRILEDYTVPEYFSEDLLGLVGERRRPPYRWFLVGPCRSGTTVHIDPLGTSAWNTLIHGVKRWVLFPPHVPKSVVKGRKLILPGEDDEAIHYFTTILPRMKRRAAASGGKGDYANFECFEFTQYAGETVFIPHGWWHAVLNISHTVGITQNYCSRRNFDEVWTQTRSGRKKMSCSWLRRLDDHHPDLARRAKELNRRDGFVMWEDDVAEQKKWRKKKAEKERKKSEKREKEKKKKASSRQQQSKKEKWGDHRTTERRKDGTVIEDVVMREVSPDV
eukprot:CAMPEP_0172301134 /NCGR_PEP_ID=MMETSP1058-20130122/3083_1 /TAXON_ID=83371 /ORGANISM="Detonula confervacea, Strain CCMP 353" /LENGTH=512 /DNA_ID=CAMNT_0013011149 /DNA_START=156 /DNA_END=1694 /DNA_ORIENTATION=+